ncbi:MAG: YihY/virulence factor BrkB family protein [Gillisia sp.]
MKKLRRFWDLLKKAFVSWNRNDPWAQSAVIAYYAIFSLPSLLIIVVTLAGYFFGNEAVQGRITAQIGQFIGKDTAASIQNMITNAALNNHSTITIIFGVLILLFGATGVFFRLKIAMNNIWNVAEKKATFLRMVIDRVISLGMVLVLGFLLLLALIVSTIIRFFSDRIENWAPVLSSIGLDIVNFVLSFVFITLLFSAIFKLLPDVKIRWKITFLGAALTTFLFLIAEYLISFYFGQSNPGSVYGGASSIVLILLWVNYTCLIMFYGAEFTVQYALFKNETITPNKYSEPAIYQEMERLKAKKVKLKEEKEVLDELASDEKRTYK